MSETSSEPELPAPGRSRWRHWRRWAVVLWAVAMLWYGWREYTYHRAVRTIEAAGYVWFTERPVDLIRKDWRALFRGETWEERVRYIVPRDEAISFELPLSELPPRSTARPDVVSILGAIYRLQPTFLSLKNVSELRTLEGLKPLKSLKTLWFRDCDQLTALTGLEHLDSIQSLEVFICPKLRDVSALRGLKGLEYLNIYGSEAFQDVEGLNGFSSLKALTLTGCPALKNLDGLRALPALEKLDLSGCTGLQDVKALHALTSLKSIHLAFCDRLSAESVAALRAALPKTEIFDP